MLNTKAKYPFDERGVCGGEITQETMNMKIALGTVQFGCSYGVANDSGRVSFKEAGDIMLNAAASGIDMLDTAIAYGESEQTLGRIGITSWHVVSKLPQMPVGIPDVGFWVETQVADSLRRLGVDELYAVLLHRPEQLFGESGKQLYEALVKIRDGGYTKKIGISVYSPAELERLFDAMSFDLVQAPLNILDRRLVESGWARLLNKKGVELHTRSVFLQGLLLMPASKRPAKFNRWQHVWNEWDRWLQEVSLSPLEACMRYALSIDEVARVVVGVDSVEHLREILAATGERPSNLPEWQCPIDLNLINPACWNEL